MFDTYFSTSISSRGSSTDKDMVSMKIEDVSFSPILLDADGNVGADTDYLLNPCRGVDSKPTFRKAGLRSSGRRQHPRSKTGCKY